MRDLKNNLRPLPVVNPVSVGDNTPSVGSIIDHQGYDSALYHIHVGSFADAGATLTPLLEESNDPAMGGANEVADADLIGTEALATFTQAEDNTVKTLGYKGSKRYTRLTLTPASNGAALVHEASCILGHALKNPTAQT